MLVLGIDSSDKLVSVGLSGSSGIIISRTSKPGLKNKNILHSLIMETIKNAGIDLENLDGVSVAIGPGSFTGLRVGLASAKGFCWSMKIPLCGVSSIEAIARCATFDDGKFLVVKDARRNEFYYGGFVTKNGELKQVIPDSAGLADDIVRLLLEDFKVAGPGTDRLRECSKSIGKAVEIEYDADRLGGEVAKLGRRLLISGEKLDIASSSPNYIRMPGLDGKVT